MSAGATNKKLGFMISAEVIVNKHGVNEDDALIMRTCPLCGKLMMDVREGPIMESNLHLMLPDGSAHDLNGVETLSARCECGAWYFINVLDTLEYDGSSITSYMIYRFDLAMDSLSDEISRMYMRNASEYEIDRWFEKQIEVSLQSAIDALNNSSVMLVSEDWLEARYTTGWIDDRIAYTC